MSKLPPQSRLTLEDFPSEKSWIGKLISPLNGFMTALVSALNNGLTFSENLSSVVRTIAVPAGTTAYPLYFSWALKSKPIGLWVVSAYETLGAHTNFTAAISADWEFTTSGQVKINGFPGLPTGTSYYVTVVAITG